MDFWPLFHQNYSDNDFFSNSSMDLEEFFDLVWHDFLVTLVVGLVRKFQRQNAEGFDLDFSMEFIWQQFFFFSNSSVDFEEFFDAFWHDLFASLVLGFVRKFQRQNVEGFDLDFLMNILTALIFYLGSLKFFKEYYFKPKEEQRSGVVRCCTLAKIKIDITK